MAMQMTSPPFLYTFHSRLQTLDEIWQDNHGETSYGNRKMTNRLKAAQFEFTSAFLEDMPTAFSFGEPQSWTVAWDTLVPKYGMCTVTLPRIRSGNLNLTT